MHALTMSEALDAAPSAHSNHRYGHRPSDITVRPSVLRPRAGETSQSYTPLDVVRARERTFQHKPGTPLGRKARSPRFVPISKGGSDFNWFNDSEQRLSTPKTLALGQDPLTGLFPAGEPRQPRTGSRTARSHAPYFSSAERGAYTARPVVGRKLRPLAGSAPASARQARPRPRFPDPVHAEMSLPVRRRPKPL
jgi:hypothetical protein